MQHLSCSETLDAESKIALLLGVMAAQEHKSNSVLILSALPRSAVPPHNDIEFSGERSESTATSGYVAALKQPWRRSARRRLDGDVSESPARTRPGEGGP